MTKFLQSIIILFSLSVIFAQGQNGPIGWASVNANDQNGTTGGEGGSVVTVNNMTDLLLYCSDINPYTIQIDGMITLTPKGRFITVSSNKTIVGLDAVSGVIEGGFRVGDNTKNVIFKNLIISDTFVEDDWDGKTQDWDGIQIKGTCHHIWVDHCTVLRQGDGAIDITNGANYVTVSNSIIGQNNKASLIGSSDTDTFTESYKVTMHHNWFNQTTQRNPRVRFGMVHLFNNYYFNMGGYGREMGYSTSYGYGIGAGVSAKIYSEHNYFEDVVNPVDFIDNATLPGYIIDIDSYTVNSGTILTRPEGIEWDPADFYEYTSDNAETVKEFVMENAGTKDNLTNSDILFQNSFALDLKCYPNPFTESTKVAFNLPKSGTVNVRLYNLIGQITKEISSKTFPAGENVITLNRGNLSPGIYIIQIEFEGRKISRRVIAK